MTRVLFLLEHLGMYELNDEPYSGHLLQVYNTLYSCTKSLKNVLKELNITLNITIHPKLE